MNEEEDNPYVGYSPRALMKGFQIWDETKNIHELEPDDPDSLEHVVQAQYKMRQFLEVLPIGEAATL